MKRLKLDKNLIFSLLAVVFLWVFWLIAYFAVQNDYLLPSFWDTIAETGRMLARGEFWRAFGGTLLRTFCAFALSFLIGTALAVTARLFSGLRAFFAPIISVLRSLPTVAIILVLLLWTPPAVAPVIVGMLVLMPAVYSAVLTALDGVYAEYGDLVCAFHISKSRTVFKLYLPLSAPPVLGQAGGIFSLGLKIIVSGEVLASTYRSLGGLMQEAKMFVQMPQLLALTLVTVLTGFLLEGACRLAYRLLLRWKP